MTQLPRRYIGRKRIVAILLMLGLIVMAIWVWGSGSKDYLDLTQTVRATARPLPTPPGSYLAVTWLTQDQLIFLYADHPSAINKLADYRLFRHTLGTDDWQRLEPPQSSSCAQAEYAPIYRLPNSMLGFGYSCLVFLDQQKEQTQDLRYLYSWDVHTGAFHKIHQYTDNFIIGPFTFAPNMEEYILENPIGAGFHNQLYRLDQGGQLKRLFPTYERVKTPSWSPDGHTIAFLGTESYTLEQPSGFLNWNQMGDRLFYPWDLYLMDAQSGTSRVVRKGIEGNNWIPGWLPDSNILIFRGRYQQTEGIWALNTQTQELTRIWPSTAESYWSPDGKQMVIIQHVQEKGIERTYPVIVDLPPLKAQT